GSEQCGDDRLRARVVCRDYGTELWILRPFAELGDVRPGNERAARTRKNDGFHRFIGERPLETGKEPGSDGMTQGIDRRIIDADDADISALFELYDFAHGRYLATRAAQALAFSVGPENLSAYGAD